MRKSTFEQIGGKYRRVNGYLIPNLWQNGRGLLKTKRGKSNTMGRKMNAVHETSRGIVNNLIYT